LQTDVIFGESRVDTIQLNTGNSLSSFQTCLSHAQSTSTPFLYMPTLKICMQSIVLLVHLLSMYFQKFRNVHLFHCIFVPFSWKIRFFLVGITSKYFHGSSVYVKGSHVIRHKDSAQILPEWPPIYSWISRNFWIMWLISPEKSCSATSKCLLQSML
jgi:hypothetical protein